MNSIGALIAAEPVQKKRNVNLDLLKVMSIIAVVGLHAFYDMPGAAGKILYCLCSFAVPVFFMCSGYVILTRGYVDWVYSLRKTAKIAFLIFMWNAIVFLIHFVPDTFGMGRPDTYTWSTFPKQVLDGALTQGNMWVLWFMITLMIIYITLPLLTTILYPRPGKRHSEYSFKMRASVFWMFLAAACLLMALMSSIYAMPIQSKVPEAFRMWTWYFYFVTGALMKDALPWVKEHISIKWHVFLLVLITAAVIIYFFVSGNVIFLNDRFGWEFEDYLQRSLFSGRFDVRAEYLYDSAIIMVWAAAIFTLIMRLDIKPGLASFTEAAAPLTLGIFVLHPTTMSVFRKYFEYRTVGGSIGIFFFGLLITALIVFIISKTPLNKWLLKI